MKILKTAISIVVVALMTAATSSGADNTTSPKTRLLAGEQINWRVISGGGAKSTSPNFAMSATAAQTAVGPIGSVNYKINQGYWQAFGSGGGCCVANSADGRTGNVDGDPLKGIDIADLTALIDYLYISFTPPTCIQSANTDGDGGGGVDIADLTALIDYLYISFTPPALCP